MAIVDHRNGYVDDGISGCSSSSAVSVCKENKQKVIVRTAAAAVAAVQLNAITHLKKRTASQTA